MVRAHKGGRIRASRAGVSFDAVNIAFLGIVVLATLYPMVYVLSMSISDPLHVVRQDVVLLPKGFSLGSYRIIFQTASMWRSYYNTIWYTVVGTALNVLFTTAMAYPLSRRAFCLQRPLNMLVTFTMFFGGGMIPAFINVTELGIYNTRWAIILPGLISTWNLILARTYFASISESLMESAWLDGANDVQILARIVLPLSMPIVAVLALYYAVGHWNSYFSAMLYLPNTDLQPVQMYLMRLLLQESEEIAESAGFERTLDVAQLKYSAIIVTALPILCVYPFLQRYFVKGVMIGAIKG